MRENSILIFFFVLIFAMMLFQWIRKRQKKEDDRLSAFGQAPTELDYELDSIELFHHYAKEKSAERFVDEITWNDLNMKDVFKRINVCATSAGEEYLYHLLHQGEFNKEQLAVREELIDWFIQNSAARVDVQKILFGLGKQAYNGFAHSLFHTEESHLKAPWLYAVLAVLPILSWGLLAISVGAAVIAFVLTGALNAFIHFYFKMHLEKDLASRRFFSAMLRTVKKLNQYDQSGWQKNSTALKEAYKPFRYVRFVGGSASAQPAANDMAIFADYVRMIFLVDIIKYNYVGRVMRRNQQHLRALFETLGEIDVAICILSYRESLPHCCLPDFSDKAGMRFEGMYHPLLNNPVVNAAKIDNDSLITGSNASGKSTFIKALAINNILAQTIHTCCASSYELKGGLVVTSMAMRDDILSGESYFIREIKSLKRIIDDVEAGYCTCFIDEILRGTNTRERIAASTAVLESLHQTKSICIAASHDLELTEILAGQYDNYHFSEQIVGDDVVFDYTLKDGPSQTRNAIRLLERMGFEQEIVLKAYRLADK